MIVINRINVIKIIKKHFGTFYDNSNSKNINVLELCVYLFVLSLGSIALSYSMRIVNLSGIINPLAIFTGFLFSALFVIIDKKDGRTNQQVDLIKEVYTNISFAVLVSFVIVFLVMLNSLFVHQDGCYSLKEYYSLKVLNGLIYFLIMNFVYSLFMVIKRLYKIFDDSIE